MINSTLNLVRSVIDGSDLVKILAVGAGYQLSQDEKTAAIQVIDQVLVSQVELTILDVVEHLQTISDLEPFARAVRRCFLP